ncbi:hypothetical protein [Alteriqipengyuania sp. 357]
MIRLLAPILLLGSASALGGCVAAALPLAAGGLMLKGNRDYKPPEPAEPQQPSGAPLEGAGRTAGEAAPATDEPPGPRTTTSVDEQVAMLSSSQVIGLAPFAEMPAPSEADLEDDGTLSGLFAKVTAVAQADPFTETRRKSAFLADPVGLRPERTECAIAQTAVLVDIDPGDGEAPLDDKATAPRELIQVLATLRAQEVAVLWLSRHTAVRAGAVRRMLLRTGLDGRGADELYLVRYEDETKATRRADAAEDFCVVAILGDEMRDFDELFAFLKDPGAAAALDPLIGEAWFLAPAPIISPPEEG